MNHTVNIYVQNYTYELNIEIERKIPNYFITNI